MKRTLIASGLALVLALAAVPAWSQLTGTVKGVCLDNQGKPIDNGTITYKNRDNGIKRDLKTNKQGEYFSLGFPPGTYDIVLAKDGKELFTLSNVKINLGENIQDIKLAEEAAAARAGGTKGAPPKLTEEQKKQLEAVQKENENVEKENLNIKQLNAMMGEAKTAADAGNLDQAVQLMTRATAGNPPYPQVFAVLGQYHIDAAPKAADAASRAEHYTKAADALQHALAMCQKEPTNSGCKGVASYHNNYGKALASSGKTQEALAEYVAAAQADPTNAAQYYYNEGAVLTNAGKIDEANAAFDKAIAADPKKPEPYYQKGVNLLGKAVIKDGKMVAPPEAEQALQKYLELQPEGGFAQQAKDLIAALGSTVQTSYGTSKAPKKKPPQ